jgi:hypothetical protein
MTVGDSISLSALILSATSPFLANCTHLSIRVSVVSCISHSLSSLAFP